MTTTAKYAILVCDVQEKFRGVIYGLEALIGGTEALLKTAATVAVDVFVSQQYPRGLGATVAELQPLLTAAGEQGRLHTHDKTAFSAVPGCIDELRARSVDNVVLVGIETHICVSQTARDLVKSGIQVYVPVDAVSSRSAFDRTVGLKQLEAAGVTLTTVEGAIFLLVGDAKHPAFKAVSALVKERAALVDAAAAAAAAGTVKLTDSAAALRSL